jgi:hypothetical protein
MVLTSRQDDGYNSNNNKTGCAPPGGLAGASDAARGRAGGGPAPGPSRVIAGASGVRARGRTCPPCRPAAAPPAGAAATGPPRAPPRAARRTRCWRQQTQLLKSHFRFYGSTQAAPSATTPATSPSTRLRTSRA